MKSITTVSPLQMGMFADIRMSDGDKGDTYVKLGKRGDSLVASVGKGLEGKNIRPSSDDSNSVREKLLTSLAKTFNLEKNGKVTINDDLLKTLSKTLGADVFKKSDFSIKNGHVVSGCPLTERRVTAIVNKVNDLFRTNNAVSFNTALCNFKDTLTLMLKEPGKDTFIHPPFGKDLARIVKETAKILSDAQKSGDPMAFATAMRSILKEITGKNYDVYLPSSTFNDFKKRLDKMVRTLLPDALDQLRVSVREASVQKKSAVTVVKGDGKDMPIYTGVEKAVRQLASEAKLGVGQFADWVDVSSSGSERESMPQSARAAMNREMRLWLADKLKQVFDIDHNGRKLGAYMGGYGSGNRLLFVLLYPKSLYRDILPEDCAALLQLIDAATNLKEDDPLSSGNLANAFNKVFSLQTDGLVKPDGSGQKNGPQQKAEDVKGVTLREQMNDLSSKAIHLIKLDSLGVDVPEEENPWNRLEELRQLAYSAPVKGQDGQKAAPVTRTELCDLIAKLPMPNTEADAARDALVKNLRAGGDADLMAMPLTNIELRRTLEALDQGATHVFAPLPGNTNLKSQTMALLSIRKDIERRMAACDAILVQKDGSGGPMPTPLKEEYRQVLNAYQSFLKDISDKINAHTDPNKVREGGTNVYLLVAWARSKLENIETRYAKQLDEMRKAADTTDSASSAVGKGGKRNPLPITLNGNDVSSFVDHDSPLHDAKERLTMIERLRTHLHTATVRVFAPSNHVANEVYERIDVDEVPRQLMRDRVTGNCTMRFELANGLIRAFNRMQNGASAMMGPQRPLFDGLILALTSPNTRYLDLPADQRKAIDYVNGFPSVSDNGKINEALLNDFLDKVQKCGEMLGIPEASAPIAAFPSLRDMLSDMLKNPAKYKIMESLVPPTDNPYDRLDAFWRLANTGSDIDEVSTEDRKGVIELLRALPMPNKAAADTVMSLVQDSSTSADTGSKMNKAELKALLGVVYPEGRHLSAEKKVVAEEPKVQELKVEQKVAENSEQKVEQKDDGKGKMITTGEQVVAQQTGVLNNNIINDEIDEINEINEPKDPSKAMEMIAKNVMLMTTETLKEKLANQDVRDFLAPSLFTLSNLDLDEFGLFLGPNNDVWSDEIDRFKKVVGDSDQVMKDYIKGVVGSYWQVCNGKTNKLTDIATAALLLKVLELKHTDKIGEIKCLGDKTLIKGQGASTCPLMSTVNALLSNPITADDTQRMVDGKQEGKIFKTTTWGFSGKTFEVKYGALGKNKDWFGQHQFSDFEKAALLAMRDNNLFDEPNGFKPGNFFQATKVGRLFGLGDAVFSGSDDGKSLTEFQARQLMKTAHDALKLHKPCLLRTNGNHYVAVVGIDKTKGKEPTLVIWNSSPQREERYSLDDLTKMSSCQIYVIQDKNKVNAVAEKSPFDLSKAS